MFTQTTIDADISAPQFAKVRRFHPAVAGCGVRSGSAGGNEHDAAGHGTGRAGPGSQQKNLLNQYEKNHRSAG
jgi:hypothetical protein